MLRRHWSHAPVPHQAPQLLIHWPRGFSSPAEIRREILADECQKLIEPLAALRTTVSSRSTPPVIDPPDYPKLKSVDLVGGKHSPMTPSL